MKTAPANGLVAKAVLAVAVVARLVPAAAAAGGLKSGGLALAQFDTIFGFGDSFTAYDNGDSGKLSTQAPASTSDSPTWLQYLSDATSASVRHTWDLAVVGAAADNSILPSATTSSSLAGQVSTFLAELANVTTPGDKWTSDGSLFAIYFGTDDLALAASSDLDMSALMPSLLSSLDTQISRLVDAGARHFLLPNLTPLHLSPAARKLPAIQRATYTEQVIAGNAALAAHVPTLAAAFPAAAFTHLDLFALALPLFRDWHAAGFDSEQPCPATPAAAPEKAEIRFQDEDGAAPLAWSDEDAPAPAACASGDAGSMWVDDARLSTRAHELLAQWSVEVLAAGKGRGRRAKRSGPWRESNDDLRWNTRGRHRHRPAAVEPW